MFILSPGCGCRRSVRRPGGISNQLRMTTSLVGASRVSRENVSCHCALWQMTTADLRKTNGTNHRKKRERRRSSRIIPERGQNTTHTILYALDAETGQELYSSKDEIDDWTHLSSITVADGSVYVTTRKTFVYAFGLKK